jgi:beta-lactam-binding protein with PASTA domain/tRNA A-37 threonylcarbamoyl transferase component Bud32
MTQPRLLGGRYELDGIVGRGGMAEVFRARDIRLDRIVGVKTLRDDLARDQTFQARFRREAQSAASLNHPSIVAVYDTGEDMMGGTPVPYIVMEFVEGRTLRDLLRDDRRLLPERAAEITDGVLRALDYSHRNGIVHRDIKPGNVMLTRSGEVKVMDFGIARAVSDSQMTMTQTAQVIGTAQYLSPEQARGERVDARSDLYSTGCLLYELLVGRPPFTGDSPVAIAYQHVKEEPVPPSRIDPEVPPWADAIVLKAMQKDPADRYQSAGEMRNDIQRALSGAQLAAPMATQTYGPGTRRMGAATQTGGRTAAIPPYSYGPDEGGTGGDQPRRKIWPWVTIAVVIVVLLAAILGLKFLTGGNTSTGTAIPNVAGQTLKQAEAALKSDGFKIGTITRQHSGTVPKNDVISTRPSGTAPKGTKINILVSSGSNKVAVPYVQGDTLGEAKSALAAKGLKWAIKHSSTPAGAGTSANTVVGQSPTANTLVQKGSTVTLFLPPKGQPMPDLEAQSVQQAINTLESPPYSLSQGQISVQATCTQPGIQPNFVCSTSPKAGQPLVPGQNVILFVVPTPTPTPTTPSPTATSPSPTTSPPASSSPPGG